MDRPYVFPGSLVLLALGLYDVAAWLSSLVDNSPWDVLNICGGSEHHFLARA